jgi:hypothetical protein
MRILSVSAFPDSPSLRLPSSAAATAEYLATQQELDEQVDLREQLNSRRSLQQDMALLQSLLQAVLQPLLAPPFTLRGIQLTDQLHLACGPAAHWLTTAHQHLLSNPLQSVQIHAHGTLTMATEAPSPFDLDIQLLHWQMQEIPPDSSRSVRLEQDNDRKSAVCATFNLSICAPQPEALLLPSPTSTPLFAQFSFNAQEPKVTIAARLQAPEASTTQPSGWLYASGTRYVDHGNSETGRGIDISA